MICFDFGTSSSRAGSHVLILPISFLHFVLWSVLFRNTQVREIISSGMARYHVHVGYACKMAWHSDSKYGNLYPHTYSILYLSAVSIACSNLYPNTYNGNCNFQQVRKCVSSHFINLISLKLVFLNSTLFWKWTTTHLVMSHDSHNQCFAASWIVVTLVAIHGNRLG